MIILNNKGINAVEDLNFYQLSRSLEFARSRTIFRSKRGEFALPSSHYLR
ncbi:hypothetical protein HNR39_001221 [Glaciimonas immobilis]|uniref:Uncharacterized protein n=1 Tax=Glaciimonas immobilis TaxID=728004 RepID=A0A840RRQ7_9BURK|nr:hypothetical protein [Glaciimonas immobilis]